MINDLFYRVFDRFFLGYENFKVRRMKSSLKSCGERVYISPKCIIWSEDCLEVGNDVCIHAFTYIFAGKDSGLKTCSSNACLARVLGQNKGFCLSWLIVNKQRKMTVFGGLLRIEIDLVSSSISKVFAQQGVQ